MAAQTSPEKSSEPAPAKGKPYERIAVVGGGSWATALVKTLARNVGQLHWWMRDEQVAEQIRTHHQNPKYLSSVYLDTEGLVVHTELRKALEAVDTVVLAVPSAFLEDALKGIEPGLLQEKVIFSAIKGIVPGRGMIIGDLLFDVYGTDRMNFGVICGPSHAEEVAMEKLSYLTIASEDPDKATRMARSLESSCIRTCLSDDIYGTEYAAVLKNVVSLAVGICHGLGYGDNFIAVLISNAIREIKRFVDEVHPIERDIKESAYLGDLLVTAYSQFSRNRMFGNMIGRGYSVKAAQFEMAMIAEGYYAVDCIRSINTRYRVDMPIADAVYNILYQQVPAGEEMERLEGRMG